jgi:type II secretory pathway component PulF
MPVFQYSVRSESGVNSSGVTFAPNEEILYQTLRKQGLFLLHSRQRDRRSLRRDRLRINQKQVLAFTIHVSTYQDAGIPLMQTLHSLARDASGVKFHAMIDGLISAISRGSTFSDALAQYPRIFDKHYVQMAATGEASGQLDARLQELIKHLEWQQDIRAQIKQSSTYPLLIIGLLLSVVVLLMTFTLPKFIKLLLQFHADLPAPTRIVIAASGFFTNYWYLLPLIPAISYAIFRAVNHTPQGRLGLDRLKLKVPFFGSLQKKIALSRFAHHFSTLHAAGIHTPAALKIVEGLVGNLLIADLIRRIRLGVESGRSLTELLSESGDFPHFVVQMLAAGEESGNLEGTLKKVSQYYDREIPAAIKRAFSVIEPLILVVMGALVAFIALSILLPIYEFGTSINK